MALLRNLIATGLATLCFAWWPFRAAVTNASTGGLNAVRAA
jgi:hypothetical protein